MSDGSFRVTALFDNEEATKTVAAPLIAMPTTENALVPVSMADRSVTLHIPTDDDISARAHTDGGKASSITDRLLAQHKSPELGDMSAKLTQLVMVSKGFDPKQAKHGIFDKAMSIFHGQKEQLLAQLQTVDQQVKRIVAELDRKVALHQQRIRDVNDLQVENLAYHEERKACVAQFQEWLDAVMTTLAQPVDNADGMAAVRLSSLNHLKQRLETGIADASNAMLLAKQRAIKLQMTGDTSRAILEQFDRVKDNVIPALKSILEDQLIALEQKDAIAFDDMLASTLDGALRANAQQTADNTVASARMLQKSTVSVSTIADCQKILDETAGKVREIEEAGRLQRIEDAAQRKAIEHDMLASVTR